ncbi:MAG: tol-pal system-associated acyl-CoA thioesterase [Candidatus Competibacterales bacterium]|nr:tol-pal system-associated acyl-CoA thioesterase [Candidatus Competibacterales bacterium]
MPVFSWPIRVYYEDTDSGGVVYYANYLRFLERARTEWLRSLGCEQDELRERRGQAFVVRALSIDYHHPARFNDRLEIDTQVERLRRASLEFFQQVRRAQASGSPLCSARVRVACVDLATLRPCPLPYDLLTEIKRGS